jgi:hypothetical protein
LAFNFVHYRGQPWCWACALQAWEAEREALERVVAAARYKQRTWEALGQCLDEFGPSGCDECVQADDTAQVALNTALAALEAPDALDA